MWFIWFQIIVIPYAKESETIHPCIRSFCAPLVWFVGGVASSFMQKGLVVLCRRARKTTAVLTCASLNSSFLADPLMRNWTIVLRDWIRMTCKTKRNTTPFPYPSSNQAPPSFFMISLEVLIEEAAVAVPKHVFVTYLIILNLICPWLVSKWIFLGSIQKYDGELYLIVLQNYSRVANPAQTLSLSFTVVYWIKIWKDSILLWLIFYNSLIIPRIVMACSSDFNDGKCLAASSKELEYVELSSLNVWKGLAACFEYRWIFISPL
jgi:hypothetical protein